MSKIYIDKDSFDFIYQLPQMFYSLIISSTVNINEQNTMGVNHCRYNLMNKVIEKEYTRIKCKISFFFTSFINILPKNILI